MRNATALRVLLAFLVAGHRAVDAVVELRDRELHVSGAHYGKLTALDAWCMLAGTYELPDAEDGRQRQGARDCHRRTATLPGRPRRRVVAGRTDSERVRPFGLRRRGDAGRGALLCGGPQDAQDIPWAFALLSWAVLLIDALAPEALVPGTPASESAQRDASACLPYETRPGAASWGRGGPSPRNVASLACRSHPEDAVDTAQGSGPRPPSLWAFVPPPEVYAEWRPRRTAATAPQVHRGGDRGFLKAIVFGWAYETESQQAKRKETRKREERKNGREKRKRVGRCGARAGT